MLRSFDTSVLIVGAGPVGLTLAMELASRGVDVTVTETRRAGEPPNVKCNQVSARSMEIFRRLGLADRKAEEEIARGDSPPKRDYAAVRRRLTVARFIPLGKSESSLPAFHAGAATMG